MSSDTAAEDPLARVVIPFAGTVRHPVEGAKLAIESGMPVLLDLEIRDEVWPHWLALARGSSLLALDARASNPGYSDADELVFGEAIQLEMRSSMAAICQTAFALEAFRSSVVHHNPAADVKAEGAAARIHQAISRSFVMNNEQSSSVRVALGQIFTLRNQAVHPASDFVIVARHPDFGVHLHPRFIDFSAPRASDVVDYASGLLRGLLTSPRPRCRGLVEWCDETTQTLIAARERSNAYDPF